MNKFTKSLLTGVVALGLLAPVATSSINSIQTTVQAKSRWHRGTPRILGGNHSVWLSNPMRTSSSKRFRYTRNITGLGGRYGINPVPFTFTSHHRSSGNGNDSSATLAVNPHYKVIGYHKYEIESGDKYSGRVYARVKVHGHNRISIWCNGQYLGYFHELSRHAAHHFEYHPYF